MDFDSGANMNPFYSAVIFRATAFVLHSDDSTSNSASLSALLSEFMILRSTRLNQDIVVRERVMAHWSENTL